jgi:hypothetical protein
VFGYVLQIDSLALQASEPYSEVFSKRAEMLGRIGVEEVAEVLPMQLVHWWHNSEHKRVL